MGQKHLKRYKELATRTGSQDPLEYLFKRFNAHRVNKNHEKAEQMANMLIEYGHGKVARVTQETGETAAVNLKFKLE